MLAKYQIQLSIIQIMFKDKDSKQSIQVTIRVRPLSDKEKTEDSRICVHLDQSHSLQLINGADTKKFTFDSISYQQSQQQIFQRVGRRCTRDCLEGYNCTVFAYGQTGAGKTYTMMGVNPDNEDYQNNKGLIPRTLKFLFECIDREREEGVNFIIRCSFLEIYNQQIIDLLNKNNTNLQLRQDTRKGVYVEGITEQIISRSEQIIDLLQKGSKSRHVGSTFYNETSSRSHSVFTMQIESKYSKNGVVNTKSRQFNFIDLAGSERTKMSTGERLKEGCNINKSLMNLASVINALSEVSQGKMQHVNYRNSKLTFLLKDSLGGNSKTDLIANISPSALFYQQTLSTLSFARRAKLIKREKASINEDSSGNLNSMKNQIKRLKQEVITLMSRLQTGEISDKQIASDQTPQMTSIMHQYVAEEIDKQTRLEMEILKLKQRITHLQTGIKHYSSNDTHLRMIITVLQDKITRLKSVQTRLSVNLDELAPAQDDTAIIKEYFENQRLGLLKQVQALRGQSQSSRIMKELLKQARMVREDCEQEDNLKELLTTNNNFLNMIHNRLQEITPDNQEIEFNAQFEKKVTSIEIEFHRKEEELLERMQQANLELSEAKNRVEQNQKLLEEAINIQIAFEEKNKVILKEKEQLSVLLQTEELKVKNLEVQIRDAENQTGNIIAELKKEILNKESESEFLKKELQVLKTKIEKLVLNENILKEEFDVLEQEKYKLDKTLLDNISQMKEQKNLLMKAQSENSLQKDQIALLQNEIADLTKTNKIISEELISQTKNYKIKLEQLQKTSAQQIKLFQEKESKLSQECLSLEEKIKSTELRLNDETEELEILAKQYETMENELKKQLEAKEFKLKELSSLINQKEENGNEIQFHMNKLKADLINMKEEKETSQNKLKKIIEELKEKLQRQHTLFQSLQKEASERAKLYEQLSNDHVHNKKQKNELADKVFKLTADNDSLNIQLQKITCKIEQYLSEVEGLKEREKEQKLLAMEMKNDLFVAKRNSEIEIEALQSQLSLKDQYIDQIEKETNKNKSKFETIITELQKQLENTKETFAEHEKSLSKSMENQLTIKERKTTELKSELNQKEKEYKVVLSKLQELKENLENLNMIKKENEKMIVELKAENDNLQNEVDEMKNFSEQMVFNHEKELEENQVIHNEQLDQRNQQIQSLENDILNLQNKIKQLELNAKTYTDRLNQQNKEITNLKLALKTESDQLEQHKKKSINLEGIVSDLINKKEQLELETKITHKEKEQLVVKFQNLAKKIEQYELNMLSQKQVNSKEMKERSEEREIFEQKLTQSLNQRESMKNKAEMLQKELNNLEQEMNKKCLELKSTSEELKMNTIEIQTLKKTYTSQINAVIKQKQNIQNELEVLKVQNEEVFNQIEKLTKSKCQLEKMTQEYKIQINSLTKQIQESLIQQQKDRNHFQKIQQKLRSELADKTTKEFSLTSTIEKISNEKNQLKQDIQSLFALKKKESEQFDLKLFDLKSSNNSLQNEVTKLSQTIQEMKNQNVFLQDEKSKYQSENARLCQENKQFLILKGKLDTQSLQIQNMKKMMTEDKQSKERLYGEVCKQRQNNDNFKLIIENSEAQVRQLQIELEEKDAIYKKLLEKIAKNDNENKKSTSSQHYLKTIQLLQKSRAEQLNLRRENDELKKVLSTLKDNLEEKDGYIKQVEKKSEGYCVSMHKRLEQIQKDYFELEKSHQRLIKEKKNLEKCSHQNDNLKEQIKTLKSNANKMVQRQEQLETRFKKCSMDYIQLEKQFEELKKGQILITSHDDKTNYINRLKAEVAALKTEKVLLTDSLNREREEKTKLKAEMRFGKDGNGDISGKIELEKKINENKNLQQLIFQIVSYLKICVNQPKTKLQTIRSVILGTIKEKNNQIKQLKDKLKEMEDSSKMPNRQAALKEFRGMNSSSYSRNLGNMGVSEEKSKFEKERDPSTLDNQSRQKMREFQNYYARFKHPDSKFRNL